MQSGKGSRELLIGVAASDRTALISNGSRAVGVWGDEGSRPLLAVSPLPRRDFL